jgi:hypothetical protein
MERRMLTDKEFKKFFDEVMDATRSTRGAPESLMEVLEKHGLKPELPASLADKIMPMLKSKVRGIKEIPHNCSWCPVCTMCAACGGLNAGSLGAAAASAVHVLD